MGEGNNQGNITPQKMHDMVRDITEKRTGHRPEKINLRRALDFSLKTRAYVDDFADEFIDGFKEYNSLEQAVIKQYLVLADLLKRGCWNEIHNEISSFLDSNRYMDTSFYKDDSFLAFAPSIDIRALANTTTIRKESAHSGLSLKDAADDMLKVISLDSSDFLLAWGKRMRSVEKDEMYKQRFTELEELSRFKGKVFKIEMLPPEVLIENGLGTAMSFAIGMIKHMPDLLNASGKEVTKETIIEAVRQNLVGLSSTYAAQDISSFSTIDSIMTPERERRIVTPTNFSPELFTLENGKITFKKGALEKIRGAIENSADISRIHDHVSGGEAVNRHEGKNKSEGGVTRSAWKTCPALFANLLMNFDDFVKPALEKILDLQKEYK